MKQHIFDSGEKKIYFRVKWEGRQIGDKKVPFIRC